MIYCEDCGRQLYEFCDLCSQKHTIKQAKLQRIARGGDVWTKHYY